MPWLFLIAFIAFFLVAADVGATFIFFMTMGGATLAFMTFIGGADAASPAGLFLVADAEDCSADRRIMRTLFVLMFCCFIVARLTVYEKWPDDTTRVAVRPSPPLATC